MDVHIRIAIIPLFFKRFSQYDEGRGKGHPATGRGGPRGSG